MRPKDHQIVRKGSAFLTTSHTPSFHATRQLHQLHRSLCHMRGNVSTLATSRHTSSSEHRLAGPPSPSEDHSVDLHPPPRHSLVLASSTAKPRLRQGVLAGASTALRKRPGQFRSILGPAALVPHDPFSPYDPMASRDRHTTQI